MKFISTYDLLLIIATFKTLIAFVSVLMEMESLARTGSHFTSYDAVSYICQQNLAVLLLWKFRPVMEV